MREEKDKLQKECEKRFNLIFFTTLALSLGFFGGLFYLANGFISQCAK